MTDTEKSLLIHYRQKQNTLRQKHEEVKQNATKIPVTGHFKMTFCPISGMVFEILSLRPTEIWQP